MCKLNGLVHTIPTLKVASLIKDFACLLSYFCWSFLKNMVILVVRQHLKNK